MFISQKKPPRASEKKIEVNQKCRKYSNADIKFYELNANERRRTQKNNNDDEHEKEWNVLKHNPLCWKVAWTLWGVSSPHVLS